MSGLTFLRLFGIPIRLHPSWIIIAVLIAWSLGAGLFPDQYKELATSTHWMMAVAATAGLFASIIVHELAHALVARRCGVEMKGITLFIFGGVAEMTGEPPGPRAEGLVAIAGPIASVLVAGVLAVAWIACALTPGGGAALAACAGVAGYLALLNGVLVAFNLVPAFPLDGGRVLRALLWWWKDDLRWATRITASIGRGFGVALIGLGVLSVIAGAFVAGMWWFLLGLFIFNAARASYQHVLIRRALEGEPVRRFMKTDPITVPPDITVQSLVDDYILAHHYKMFPVREGGELIGWVASEQVRDIPRDEWSRIHLSDIVRASDDENTIDADADAIDAFRRMSRTGTSRLLVSENGRVAGILAMKDLMRFLSLKMELEEGQKAPWG
ncbi:MAG: site-2 protease family protein [Planctomycetota bacterium]|nr:site-2 protease family protein [Planctomycetota bacterium]